MEYRFNVTKGDRKALVKAISEYIGGEPVYKGVPSCAYEVNAFTIDRLGTLITNEDSSNEEVNALLAELQNKGFLYETEYLVEIPALDEQHGDTDPVDGAETKPNVDEADASPVVTIEEVPTGEFVSDSDHTDEDEHVPDDTPVETSMQDELPEDENPTISEETDGEMDTPTSDAGHSTAALPDESPTAYFETEIIDNKLAISVPFKASFA